MAETPADVISQDEVLCDFMGFPRAENYEFGFRVSVFNVRMRRLRVGRGWSQKQLAEIVKISEAALGSIEGFRKFPSPEVAEKIATTLGVRTDFLFPEWLKFYVLDKSTREFVSMHSEVEKALVDHPWSRFKSSFVGETDFLSFDPEQRVLTAEQNQFLEQALKSLKPTEQKVIALRFGVEGQTLDEVGEKIGLTRERARQIEAQALEKLRQWRSERYNFNLELRANKHGYMGVNPKFGVQLSSWGVFIEEGYWLRLRHKDVVEQLNSFQERVPIIWYGDKVTTLLRWLRECASEGTTEYLFQIIWPYLPISEIVANEVMKSFKVRRRRSLQAVS